MIVADTNLIAPLLMKHPNRDVAESVWRVDADWHTAALWESELRNVLLEYLRRNLLTMDEGNEAMVLARRVITPERAHRPADKTVLTIASQSRLSAYDSEFVAVAMALGVPLVTWDKDVLAAFPGLALAPERFVAR